MSDSVNDAKVLLSQWREKRIVLDYWFLQHCEFTQFGWEIRQKSGRGTLIHFFEDMLIFQVLSDAKLELRITGEIIVEYLKRATDGFQLQIRTPDHSTWILLKPHSI